MERKIVSTDLVPLKHIPFSGLNQTLSMDIIVISVPWSRSARNQSQRTPGSVSPVKVCACVLTVFSCLCPFRERICVYVCVRVCDYISICYLCWWFFLHIPLVSLSDFWVCSVSVFVIIVFVHHLYVFLISQCASRRTVDRLLVYLRSRTLMAVRVLFAEYFFFLNFRFAVGSPNVWNYVRFS